MREMKRRLSLQAKIILVLIAVILPTFLIVTIAENKLTQPILEQEIRQMGINVGKRLAAEIVSSRMLSSPNPAVAVDNALQEMLFTEPDILRLDVFIKDHTTGNIRLLASNIDQENPNPGNSDPKNAEKEESQDTLEHFSMVENVTARFITEEKENRGVWEIDVPIEQKARDSKVPKKILGTVHLVVSTQLVGRMLNTFWKTTVVAAVFSVISLILALSYFLRKTIENDRLLREAESENLELTEQLHETQRQLIITEKLAVMGQLTASLAHEIGTPLNAIGGHLQLLKEEVDQVSGQISLESTLQHQIGERFEIVENQLSKIEKIVKGFLQSTSKPVSPKQLIDLNRLVEKTVNIVAPRIDHLRVDMRKKFNGEAKNLRIVALDLEQILLNLFNNSLDSIQSKLKKSPGLRCSLEVSTCRKKSNDRDWTEITVYDTGEGIKKSDLGRVLKPFYTTKLPGEGTGLGLTICQQLAVKYGGELAIDSKEGSWTRVSLLLPHV